jgi:hypothetical protein
MSYMKTLNTSLTINGREQQVLVSYTDKKIESVLNERDEVIQDLAPDQLKALEKEIAWNQLKHALRNEGVPTQGYRQMMEEK